LLYLQHSRRTSSDDADAVQHLFKPSNAAPSAARSARFGAQWLGYPP
jgi:hypothetical protein